MTSAELASSATVSSAAARASGARRRLLVVSYLAEAPFSPRGIRTRALVERFERGWEVELVAGPAPSIGAPTLSHRVRRLASKAASRVLLDKFEPWSRRRLHGYRPAVDGAYLIGFPFSPLAYIARELTAAATPYVVDIGDPWALTAHAPAVRGIALARARRAERKVWASAAGAVVTTYPQAIALERLFPALPILVRPNGIDAHPIPESGGSRRQGSVLRLAHFGSVYSARLDVGPLLNSLAASGLWDGIELHQYGPDWKGELHRMRDIRLITHERRAWSDIVARSADFDAVLVIGNRDPGQLPSKAVDYLALPIPRIAVTQGGKGDALTAYLSDKSGWLLVAPNETGAAELVRQHVARYWSAGELAPPRSESWEAVSAQISDFLARVLRSEAQGQGAAATS